MLAAPTAMEDSYRTAEDELLSVSVVEGVLTNDSDADGDRLSSLVAEAPMRGALTLNTDGSFTYHPEEDFFGTDSFKYFATDGTMLSLPTLVTIEVDPWNDLPSAAADRYGGLFGQTLSVGSEDGVLANDVDIDNDVLSAVIVEAPMNGNLSLALDGSFVYVPNFPAAGADAFSYRAHDGSADSHVTSVDLFFADDSYSTSQGVPLHVGLVNGSFETGDFTGWTTFTEPGGTLGGAGFPDVVRFDTNDDSIDTRSAQFLVGGGGGGIHQTVWLLAGDVRLSADVAVRSPVSSEEAGRFELLLDGFVLDSHDFETISANGVKRAQLSTTIVDVTPGPHEIRVRSVRQAVSSFGSSPISYVDNVQVFGEAMGVLANDRGSGVSLLHTMLLTPPEHGSIELREDGSFRYEPDSAFVGEDRFVYKPVESDEGITLYSVDTRSDKLLKIDSQSGEIEIVGAIGHDMESVDLVFDGGTLYALNHRDQSIFELLAIDPVSGRMVSSIQLRFRDELKETKGITAVDGELYVIFAHVANYCGGACSAAHVLGRLDPNSGRITELANYRSVDGGFRHDWNSLATDLNGEIIAHRLASEEVIQTHRLRLQPPSLRPLGEIRQPDVHVNDATVAGTSHFILSPEARRIYRLDPGVGYSQVLETIRLGPLGEVLSGLAFEPLLESKAATVRIVVPDAGAPMAMDDAYQVDEDVGLSVPADAGLLANDTDQPGIAVEVVLTRGPLGGSIQSDRDGSFQYLPRADFNGIDFFQYQAVSDRGQSNVATVTIEVNPMPDVPRAVDDAYEAFLNGTLLVPTDAGVLANDRDGDNDAMTLALVEDVLHGTLIVGRDGSFLYRPEAGFLGADRFTYRASDGQSESNIATVTIDVRLSPPPIAAADFFAMQEDESLLASPAGVLANDLDPNGDPMTAMLVSDVSHGTLTFDPDGTFLYVPEQDYFGLDRFTYQASDGTSASGPVTVEITVRSVNDLPVSRDDLYDVPVGRPLEIDASQGVLANDEDIEQDRLSAVLIQGPRFGTLVLEADGSFQYTAGDEFTTTDSFTYRASDDQGESDVSTVVLRADIPIIEVGHHSLRANATNQQIEVFVAGGQTVAGVDLFVMVGDGGPEAVDLGLPAGTDGPSLVDIDLKTATIFSEIPDQSIDLGSLPQVANWSLSATGGTDVDAEGLLVTLTIDTTGFIEGMWELRLADILPDHAFGPFHTTFAGVPALVENGSITVQPTEVLGRHVFYNNSEWDGDDTGAGPRDDASIATDKTALLPGETATFANYTSYSRGINGVMLDVARLPDPLQLALDDFELRVGRNNDPTSWRPAPRPQLFARPGAGVDGSDRITLTWPDNAIQQQWLEVRLKSTARTLLPRDDVFYFGNAIGEVGDTAGRTFVTSTDVIGARDHQRGPFDMAPLTDVYDFNRDRLVSSIDVIIARDHQVGPLTALPLITPLGTAPARPVLIGDVNADGVFNSADLVQVFQSSEYEDRVSRNSTWAEGDWNGDQEFDTADLVLAFQQGHFESLLAAAKLSPRDDAAPFDEQMLRDIAANQD